MFGQTSTTTTTPPPTDRGLEDLDAAALAYAARIEGLPPERRGEARDDLVRFALAPPSGDCTIFTGDW
ncbi:hypothetical protein ACWCO3_34615 [Micromonospora sp. NPDC002411]